MEQIIHWQGVAKEEATTSKANEFTSSKFTWSRSHKFAESTAS